MRLTGKVAVITGGAAGIGFAYARRFLAEGDVSDAASVRAMIGAAVARFGRIDVLVNNTAVFATLTPPCSPPSPHGPVTKRQPS